MRSRYWLTAAGPRTRHRVRLGRRLQIPRGSRRAASMPQGVEKVVIRAGAGDMKVVGRSNAVRVEARGHGLRRQAGARRRDADHACAAKATWFMSKRSCRRTTAAGTAARTNTRTSTSASRCPRACRSKPIDSSGDTVIEDLGALTMQDSSGDLEIRRIAGAGRRRRQLGRHQDRRSRQRAPARQLRRHRGRRTRDGDVDVTIDSSGDIRIAQVGGSVRIEQDSSGGIRVEDVKGSVNVDSDSSGDIYAGRVGGDFTVSEDSSGSIDHDVDRAARSPSRTTSATRENSQAAVASGSSARRSACRRNIGPKLWRSKKAVSAATSGARRVSSARPISSGMLQAISVRRRDEERGLAMLDELRGELARAAHRDLRPPCRGCRRSPRARRIPS